MFVAFSTASSAEPPLRRISQPASIARLPVSFGWLVMIMGIVAALAFAGAGEDFVVDAEEDFECEDDAGAGADADRGDSSEDEEEKGGGEGRREGHGEE